MHHWFYAALQRDSPCIRIHISTIKVHTFLRASSYNFLPPTLHAHAETALFVFLSPPLSNFFLLHTWCRQRHFDDILQLLANQCVHVDFLMQTRSCARRCGKLEIIIDLPIGFPINNIISLIWSLRVSVQDWVAEACAPMPDASKSLVGASTQCTQIYPNVHEDCTWPRSKYLSAFAHWR